jgi:DNA-binding FadR family transcriptional regulator
MTETKFIKPIKARKLSDIVERQLRELIAAGKFKPGERLPSELQLSKQFQVSVAPIREALRSLEVSGNIIKKRGKKGGTYVKESNSENVINTLNGYMKINNLTEKDMLETRLLIEPYVAQKAASVIDTKTLNAIEINLDETKSLVDEGLYLKDEQALFQIEEKNIEFHNLIASTHDNIILKFTVEYVLEFLLELKLTDPEHIARYVSTLVPEHNKIFVALKSRDGHKSQQAMHAHLVNVHEINSKVRR